VYRWSIDENPFLPADYVANIKRSHHGGLAERFVFGRFAAVGAGTVPFDYTRHVVNAIDKSQFKEVVYGVDFGWDDPSVIVPVGFDRDSVAYVPDEYYQARVTQDSLLAVAKNYVATYGAGTFYCDPSAKQTIEWLKSHGLRAQKSEPARDEGIREMAGRFTIADDRTRIKIHNCCVNLIAELQTYDSTQKGQDHAVDALRYALGSRMKRKGDVNAWMFG
jgi:hypothetical protein